MDYLQYCTERNYQHTLLKRNILVLNLVINGLPSILEDLKNIDLSFESVLNLVINGLPSIQEGKFSL